MDQGGRPGSRIARLQALAALGLGLFAFRALVWLPEPGFLANFEAWLFEPGILVTLPIVLGTGWLLVRRWRAFVALPARPARGLAAICLGISAVLYTWSLRIESVPMLLPSLSALLAGLAASRAGAGGCRVLALPILFPLLALPLPAPLRNEVIWVQQEATASVTASILGWLGLSAYAEGILIQRPGALFIVIESCSGFRFAQVFATVGLLFRGFASPSVARALLMGFAGLVTGLLLNELRVLWIVLTSSRWDVNSDHAVQGLVAMLLGIPLLWAAHRLVEVARPAAALNSTPERRAAAPADVDAATRGSALGLMALFAALGVLLPAAPPERGSVLDLSEIPAAKGEWNSALLPTDFLLLGSVRFDQVLRRGYEHRDGTRVELFIGSVGTGGLRESPFSRVTELPQTGWVVLERAPAEIEGRTAERLLLAAQGARALAYTWRIGDTGLARETLRAALALRPGQFGAPLRRTVVRVSMELAVGGPADRVRAERRLREFVETFLSGLDLTGGN